RIDMILRRFAHRRLRHSFLDATHEFIARSAEKHIDTPGLQVAARWRARRLRKDASDGFRIDRVTPESTYGFSRGDRLADFHAACVQISRPACGLSLAGK